MPNIPPNEAKIMKKILIFGTFDGLHEGHLNLFKQAKDYGDYLIVVVARDKNVLKIKNHLPERNEEERLKDLQNCELIDEALLGDEIDPYKRISEIRPDVICLGYDQIKFTDKLEEKLKSFNLKTEIYRLKSYFPEKFHSSILNK